MKTTSELLKFAESLVGAPFRELGRDRAGIDCLGIVLAVYRFAGIELPDPVTTARDATLQHRLMDHFRPLNPSEEMRDLDVFDNGDHHVGVIVGNHAIHTSRKSGVLMHRARMIRQFNLSLYRHRGGAPC